MEKFNEKYILWYTENDFTHIDSLEKVLETIERLAGFTDDMYVTIEHFVGNKYIGETDYSMEEFLKYIA